MKIRNSGMTSFELALFYALCFGVVLSGFVWMYFDQFVRVANQIGINHHPAQAFTLSIHGVFAWVFVFTLGWILGVHLRFVWPLRQKRKSGVFLSSIVFVMCASGFGLYYLSGEETRQWTATIHWALGVIFVITLLSHVFLVAEPSRPRRKK